MQTLQRFFKLARVNFFALAGSILLALLATGLQGINYVLMIPAINALISGNAEFIRRARYFKDFIDWLPRQIKTPDTHLLFFLIGLIFLITLLKIFVQSVFDINGMRQTQQVASRLRLLIYERCLGFGKSFFDQCAAGSLQNILMNHPRHIAQGLKSLQQTFYSMAMLAISLTLMFRISWRLTLVTILLWPLLNLSVGGIIRQIRNSSVLFARANADLAKKVSNALFCMPLIKACSFEEEEKARFEKPSEFVDSAAAVVAWKQFLIGPIQETAGLAMIFILIGLLAYNLVDQNAGHTAAAYLVFFFILRRTTPLLGTFTRLSASVAAMRGPCGELENIFSNEKKFRVTEGQKEFGRLQSGIRFDRLSFEYPGRQQALKKISFDVKKGKMTALVGPTGAGKTTLIHLLMRFYDCPPRTILADGQDLCEFSLKSFHKRVAFISQEPLLFNETIRFNLNYGLDAEAPAGEIEMALRQAKLYDFTRSLPQGIDTSIGDRGIQLSGGEKQRLSIARALLRNADILILDEATSALDSETERLIQEALTEVVKDKTTLVIAHRFSTIRGADHIVVLEDGGMVEEGSLAKLLEKKGLFWKLWEAQRFY